MITLTIPIIYIIYNNNPKYEPSKYEILYDKRIDTINKINYNELKNNIDKFTIIDIRHKEYFDI
jgi:hypothetical protein